MSSYKKVKTFIDFLTIQHTRVVFLSISIFYLVDPVIRRVDRVHKVDRCPVDRPQIMQKIMYCL